MATESVEKKHVTLPLWTIMTSYTQHRLFKCTQVITFYKHFNRLQYLSKMAAKTEIIACHIMNKVKIYVSDASAQPMFYMHANQHFLG